MYTRARRGSILIAWSAPLILYHALFADPVVISRAILIDDANSDSRSGLTVVIHDGRIAEIVLSDDYTTPEVASRVNGAGKYLIPGL